MRTGTGLALVSTVLINGVSCAINSVSATSVSCVTGPRGTTPLQFTLAVIGSTGRAEQYYRATPWYRYIDKWSALSTWLNNEPPIDGDFVVVPDGQAVLMDVSPPALSVLLVQGVMAFDASAPLLTLDAEYILIFGGILEVGALACFYPPSSRGADRTMWLPRV